MHADSNDSFTTTARPGGKANAHEYINTIMLVVYSAVVLVGTVGNGLVIYVTGFRMKRSVNSVWFLNLAVADFLFTSFLIFIIISLSQGYHWPFGEVMCKLATIIALSNMFASIFLLMAISLDRCLCTWVVVWSQNHRTVRKAQLMCSGIWLVALAFSIPYGNVRTVRVFPDITLCGLSPQATHIRELTHIRLAVGFVVPLLVITGSYIAIGLRTRRFNRAKSKRSLRIIVAIVLAFVFCWIPHHVLKYIEIYGDRTTTANIRRFLGPISSSLTAVNSCLNPLLYVFMCDEFIKKLRQSLFHVLEAALAEDHLSVTSNHSMSHLSRIFRRSESGQAETRKDTSTSLTGTFTEVPTFEDKE